MKNRDINLSSSQKALRRLLIVIGVVIGIALYIYGWNTTEISLDEVQNPDRQASLQRAMRELLSPDLFTRHHDAKTFFVKFPVGCPAGEKPDGRSDADGSAYVIFSPSCADPEAAINVKGYHFPANAIARIQLYREGQQSLPFNLARMTGGQAQTTNEAVFDIDGAGYFNVNVLVPKGRGIAGQTQQVVIETMVPSGFPSFSQTTHTVTEKMIETIFLALMATTLALPISVALSFLSARNLMREINMPLGNVLVGFVLAPLGAVLGYSLLGWVGRQGIHLGKHLWPGLFGAAVATAAFVFASQLLNRLEFTSSIEKRARSVAVAILLLIVLIFVLGALGGVGIWLGQRWEHGFLKDLGSFVGTLGKLIDLAVATLAALFGALWLASLGATLSAGPLRHVYSPTGNILGAALGFVSGAILLGCTAYIGTQAVLLGLLTPIVAAVLGGQILVMLYQHFVGGHKPKHDQNDIERLLYTLLFFIGAAAVFIFTAFIIDLVRAVVDGRLPSTLTWNLGLFKPKGYVVKSALIGAVLGGVGGGLAGTQTSFPLGLTIYNTSRTIMNALRSIEPLIMGIVFVIWVGVGPFAGVLALTLHSIASLGKLYSEQVESIDAGPLEAIQATGANRLQAIIYGVVPQIVPPYISFTMYRWDINVRMSTIIGFVGGGGIGFLLQQQINLTRYNQAGVAVLAIAIVVSILDYASAAIREHVV